MSSAPSGRCSSARSKRPSRTGRRGACAERSGARLDTDMASLVAVRWTGCAPFQIPFVPAEARTQRARVFFGTNQAVVVPVKAGTHNHQGFGCRCLATSLYFGVLVPAFAGTTAESHCFTSSEAGTQSREYRLCSPGFPAFAKASAGRTSGARRSPKGEDGPLSRERTDSDVLGSEHR